MNGDSVEETVERLMGYLLENGGFWTGRFNPETWRPLVGAIELLLEAGLMVAIEYDQEYGTEYEVVI